MKLPTIVNFNIPVRYLGVKVILCNRLPDGPWDDHLEELPTCSNYERGGVRMPVTGKLALYGPLPHFKYVVFRLPSGFITGATGGLESTVPEGMTVNLDYSTDEVQ